MKKAIISLGLAFGLWGLTASCVQAQIDPWHINTYEVTSTEGTFTDISTNPDAITLGADLADGADLKNMTFSQAFVYDTTYKKGADGEDSVLNGQKVIDKITASVDYTKSMENVTAQTADENDVAGFPLGFSFNLFGKQMTHFVVSAYGGIYFRDKNRQGKYTTMPTSMPAKYAVWAQPYLRSAATDANTKIAVAGLVRKDGDKAPAYYLIEGTDGNHVLTVQHHYLVRGETTGNDEKWDQWTFQFKCYEATGKIEFIVKELAYGNAFTHATKGKYHRIMISLTDYAGFTPATEDPYGSAYLNIAANGSNHRVFLCQTDAESAENGWNAMTLSGSFSGDANTMRVDAKGPGEGRTISFTQQDAPATVEPLPAEAYKKISETITANSYTAKYIYNETVLPTVREFAAAGPIMAVISESETPDYTLENGTLYTKGHEFAEVNGFKPKVLANTMPKLFTANWAANTYTYPAKNYEVEFNATDLKKQTTYYIHLYRLAYAGKNAPVYSPVCHTISFETAFSDPKTLEAGLADIDGVTLKVAPADALGVIVIKSNTPNVKPSGQLKKGDKIGDNAEVIELLTAEKTWKLPLDYGEGCFIIAVSVIMDDENNYTYSPSKKYISVGTAYKGLPGVVDFTTLPFGVPNFEYNGINIRTQDFAKLEPTTYRDLPFGYTRTERTGEKDRAFGIGQPSYEPSAPHLVYAKTLVKGDLKETIDFITPPIVADNNRILMTFNTNWFTSNDAGEVIDMKVGGEKDTRLYCSIEYAIDNGAWQKGADFYGYDLPGRENGYYPVSFSLTAENDQSFIGKKIRFRFISQFIDTTDIPDKGFVGIGSIDIKEDKLCQTVTHVAVYDSLTTNTKIGLTWNDPNYPAASAYDIAYKSANASDDAWRTKKVTKDTATIENLEANTAYAVRVTADCGSSVGKAYASATVMLSTIITFPYTDDLSQDEPEIIIVGGNPVSVAGKTPFDRGVTTYIGTLPAEGYAKLNTATYGWTSSASSARVIENEKRSTSVGVRETESKGWLLMPAVYIPSFNIVYPKTIRFKANSAHMYASETKWTAGIGPKYTDAKLYVLISHNSQFAKKDTLTVIEVSGADIDHRAYEFDVPERLLKDGRSQVAFFFENPKATDGGENGNDDAMLFEIYDFEYVYADGVCVPPSSLVRTHVTPESATFTWEGYNESYKIFWGVRGAGYTDSVALKETTYTLTGLKEGTRYNVKVVGYCDEAGTEEAPIALTASFTTQETCHTPEEFAVSGITSTGVTFSSVNEQGSLTQRLVYLTAVEEEAVTRIISQTGDQVTVNGLRDKTAYTAQTQSVCGFDSSALSEPITFTTLADTFLIMLRVLPNDECGTVTGQGRYEKNSEATVTATPAEGYAFVAWVFGKDTVSKDAIYTFEVKTAGTYTAIFAESTANEDAISAAFNVSTKAGHLLIQNLKGLTIEEVTVYSVTGRRLGRFTPNSREDLSLPVAAQRAVLVVRVASEQGVSTYKVYLQ